MRVVGGESISTGGAWQAGAWRNAVPDGTTVPIRATYTRQPIFALRQGLREHGYRSGRARCDAGPGRRSWQWRRLGASVLLPSGRHAGAIAWSRRPTRARAGRHAGACRCGQSCRPREMSRQQFLKGEATGALSSQPNGVASSGLAQVRLRHAAFDGILPLQGSDFRFPHLDWLGKTFVDLCRYRPGAGRRFEDSPR